MWGAPLAGTFTAVWVPGGLPYGGAIVITGNASFSPIGSSVITSYCSEAYSTVLFPLSYLAGPSFGIPSPVYPVNNALPVPVIDMAVAAMGCWKAMMANLCNATFSPTNYSGADFRGDGIPVGILASSYAISLADGWPLVLHVRNTCGLGVAPNGDRLGAHSVPGTVLAVSNVAPQAQSAQLLPDFEVGINNGSSIYSISSNTFTEP